MALIASGDGSGVAGSAGVDDGPASAGGSVEVAAAARAAGLDTVTPPASGEAIVDPCACWQLASQARPSIVTSIDDRRGIVLAVVISNRPMLLLGIWSPMLAENHEHLLIFPRNTYADSQMTEHRHEWCDVNAIRASNR
jgi:hypothetical protein